MGSKKRKSSYNDYIRRELKEQLCITDGWNYPTEEMQDEVNSKAKEYCLISSDCKVLSDGISNMLSFDDDAVKKEILEELTKCCNGNSNLDENAISEVLNETDYNSLSEKERKNINSKINDYCSLASKKADLINDIWKTLAKCRYILVLHSKRLKMYCLNMSFKGDVVIIINDMAQELLTKVPKFLENYSAGKNDNFVAYFRMYAPLQTLEEIRKKYGIVKIPEKIYRLMSEIKKIEDDFRRIYNREPAIEEIVKIFNDKNAERFKYEDDGSKKKTFKKMSKKGVIRLLDYWNLISQDSTDEYLYEDDEETKGDIITEPDYDQRYTLEERETLEAFVETFESMLSVGNFEKYYTSNKTGKVNKSKANPTRYKYFQMFYTCETLKYIKCEYEPFYNFLNERSHSILNICDDGIFEYTLNLDVDNATCFSVVKDSEFKKYSELCSFFFASRLQNERICVEAPKVDNKTETWKLTLKDEDSILASYAYLKKGNSSNIGDSEEIKAIRNAERSNESQQRKEFDGFMQKFLYSRVKRN